jgi:hypothetical protein
MSLGGGGGDTQTIQKADPWEGAQPYIKDALKRGQQVTSAPYNFYNGDQIAGFAPEQELGFNLGTQRAMAGSPTLGAANRSITSTLNGDYLSPNSNPYLQQNVGQAMDDVTGRINSQFNNNNFGGSAHQETLTRNLGDVSSQMYGDNFARERGLQLSAAGQAIPLAGADYMDASALEGIGAQRQGLSQKYLDQASGQFNGANNHQYDQLSRYLDVIRAGQGVGGTTTTTQSGGAGGSSPIAGALGGAASGAGLASAMGWAGPWGAVAGGVLGLLSS